MNKKRIISAILACALVFAAAGCKNDEKNPETTTNGKKTEVAYQAPEEPDTTIEAVEYLRSQVPLFAKYLETRMNYPLTFETETTTDEGVFSTAIYILDENSLALTSVNADGVAEKTIYDGGMLYFVDGVEKIIYSADYTEENAAKVVKSYLLKIDVNDVKGSAFETGAGEYEGTEYNTEKITTGDAVTEYYFDKKTDELKYIVSAESVSKVTKLKNFADKTAFELPEGYTESTLEEYFAKLAAEQQPAEGE